MTAESFDAVLRTLLNRTPFRPFTVELHNNNQFEVDHNGAVAYNDGVAVYVAPGGRPKFFDHESVVQFIDDLSANKEEE
jgi:hypothetical protein